jgi:hypothetical protein
MNGHLRCAGMWRPGDNGYMAEYLRDKVREMLEAHPDQAC